MKHKKTLQISIVVVAVLLVIWLIWGNITVGVTRYTLASNRLPNAFDHYKIVVVSDLHNAEFGEHNDVLVDLVKQEKPDMIALTGDLLDSQKTNMEIAQALVQQLVTIAPCCYVTGNHEAWLGESYQALEKILQEESVVVLHDAVIQLKKGGQAIQIAGLDDPDFTDRDSSIQQSMLETKLERLNLGSEYCVLLSHRPEAFEAYANQKVDLVLSGHAHGGQFRIPFVGGMIAPNQGFFPKYDAGIYTQDNTAMIVSRGVGNSIIPLRVNNRPEIVSIELLCAE